MENKKILLEVTLNAPNDEEMRKNLSELQNTFTDLMNKRVKYNNIEYAPILAVSVKN